LGSVTVLKGILCSITFISNIKLESNDKLLLKKITILVDSMSRMLKTFKILKFFILLKSDRSCFKFRKKSGLRPK